MIYLNTDLILGKDVQQQEAYKALRSNLLFCGDDKKVILVTSSIPGEGKSSVSLGLAVSLAESGKKVLFIDGDMRKSMLYGRYPPLTMYNTVLEQQFSVLLRYCQSAYAQYASIQCLAK